MSNSYTQFSEYLILKTPEEEEWIRRHVFAADLTNNNHWDQETCEPISKEAKFWNEVTVGEFIDIEFKIVDLDPGRALWIHSDESGTPEYVVALVRRFFQEMRSDGIFSLTFAITESKPLAGGFSGGAVVCTADEEQWMILDDWVPSMERQLEKRKEEK